MADDIRTIEDAIAAVVTPLVTRVRNAVVASDTARQNVQDRRGAKQAADFPKLWVERGRSRRNPFGYTTTFGTFGGTTYPRIEQRSQEFVITVVADARGDIVAGQLESDIEEAIIGLGPQLGLPLIVRMLEEIASTNELTSKGKADGVERRVFTTTVRVGMRKAV